MDKQLLKFLNKEVRYVDTICGVGIEPLGNREFVTIKFKELNTDVPAYSFWNNPYKKPSKLESELESEIELEAEGWLQQKRKPKHSGNKLAYAKLYISEIKKYPKDKLSYEYAGMCMHLASFIEWDTGYLVTGYGKRKRYMKRQSIAKTLDVSDSTARRLISKLEELKLIHLDKTGYKMIGKLFAKGREINENQI